MDDMWAELNGSSKPASQDKEEGGEKKKQKTDKKKKKRKKSKKHKEKVCCSTSSSKTHIAWLLQMIAALLGRGLLSSDLKSPQKGALEFKMPKTLVRKDDREKKLTESKITVEETVKYAGEIIRYSIR